MPIATDCAFSELIDIRIADVDMVTARLFVRRLKGSLSTSQPIEDDKPGAIRAGQRQRSLAIKAAHSPFLFLSERGPFTRQALNYLVQRIGHEAELTFQVHPHMLRHSCGFYLANKGLDTRLIQDYLGHRNIAHTTPTPERQHRGSRGFGDDWTARPTELSGDCKIPLLIVHSI